MANPSLIIIGNGFDLAHELKTKYSDFLVWYFNKNILPKIHLGDLTVNSSFFRVSVKDLNYPKYLKHSFNNIYDIDNFISNSNFIQVNYSNIFINNLFNQILDKNWVDIEYKYFCSLKNPKYRTLETVKKVNLGFEIFKNEFIDYLREYFNLNNINKIDDIANVFKEIKNKSNKICVLNFNYTNTIKKYRDCLIDNFEIINIHGSIDKVDSNPIIFGYGDEMDENIKILEDINENEFLINLKSMSYHLTENYRRLLNFLESDNNLSIYIIGHSCGISDRLLLNTIFEHKNCKRIIIYYHQWIGTNEIENDYFSKCLQIYRHFNKDNKNKSRELIVPFSLSKPLISIK